MAKNDETQLKHRNNMELRERNDWGVEYVVSGFELLSNLLIARVSVKAQHATA